MMDLTACVGRVICDLRRAAGISQEELGERAGIHRTYVSQLERGIKSPTIVILQKLSDALSTKPSSILNLAENIFDEI
jgi:transcriptional regulator with XRE-family HTH domain